MKNLILLAATLLILGSSSCSKDDDIKAPDANFLTIGTENYELDAGFLEDYGQETSEPAYNFDLYLHAGLSLDPNTAELSGFGTLIYFELLSSTELDLASGTYEFDAAFDQSFTYAECTLYEEYDTETEKAGSVTFIQNVTLKVSKSGSIYTMEMSGKTLSDRAVSGRFVGALPHY